MHVCASGLESGSEHGEVDFYLRVCVNDFGTKKFLQSSLRPRVFALKSVEANGLGVAAGCAKAGWCNFTAF